MPPVAEADSLVPVEAEAGSLVLVPVSPPQAARLRTMAPASRMLRSFFMFGFPLFLLLQENKKRGKPKYLPLFGTLSF